MSNANERIYFSIDKATAKIEATDTGPQIVGYAAVFDEKSSDLGGYVARIKRGAFNKTLASDKEVYALVDHNLDKPIGSRKATSLKLAADDIGLKVSIAPPDTTLARDTLENIKGKLKQGMSFGFPTSTAKIKWTVENGQKIREIYDLDLEEISVVTRPAFPQTAVLASFSLDSVEKTKEQIGVLSNKNIVTNKGLKNMSISWTEIKRLEEKKATTFSKANALRAKDELIEDEPSELDRLCGEVDSLSEEIDSAKSTYFNKPAPRKTVMQSETQSSPLEKIGFKKKDIERYSLLRAINRRVNGLALDGIEAEVNEEMIKFTGKTPQGFFFPMEMSLHGNTQFAFDTTAGAGAINQSVLTSSFIELLRTKTLVNRLGATVLDNLVGNISIPKQTAGATAYWVSESGAPTASSATVGQVAMSPKTVGAYTDISRRMILQTSLSAEAFVRNDLATTLAIELDRAAFNGSGTSNQPTGILNQSGVNVVTAGSSKFVDMVALESAIEDANALNGNLSYVARPSAKATLKTTAIATGTGQMVWANDSVNGYSAYSTTNLPTNLGAGTNKSPVIFGNFADLVLGFWGALDILVDPYTASSSGTVRVRALQDVDIAVRHAQSFGYVLY